MNYLETQARPAVVRKIDVTNARQGIVNLAVDFGFELGHPAHVYVSQIGQDNPELAQLFTTVLDANDRRKRGRNPVLNGEINGIEYRNPQVFLRQTVHELGVRLDRMQRFVDRHVTGNESLPQRSAQYLKTEVMRDVYFSRHAEGVRQVLGDSGRIAMEIGNCTSFIYPPMSNGEFYGRYVANNDALSEGAKAFIAKLMREKKMGRFSTYDSGVSEDQGRVVVENPEGRAYFYMPLSADEFVQRFVDGNKRLTKKAKAFLSEKAQKGEIAGISQYTSGVSQDGKQIAIKSPSGASYYYLD